MRDLLLTVALILLALAYGSDDIIPQGIERSTGYESLSRYDIQVVAGDVVDVCAGCDPVPGQLRSSQQRW